MTEFVKGIDWIFIAEQSKKINWSAHASVAYPQHSKGYAKFKEAYDSMDESKKATARGIYYPLYVRLIATCKALGLIK